ncbi:hypothetical protein BLNAU_5774 [Blattamonas nauphoetae]|uniref:MD-2-related lipid-recognition domain-containing protein n=1 Tax=Blattamonas nauphoetae TaxID=2049346 RepID=A0ABQ9Y631_9EUKA|nr:hypothetical protein BLNAU_5774 [Blattamonas nauphoetae]
MLGLSLYLFAHVACFTFQDCSDGTSIVKVKEISFKPDPIIRNANITVHGAASVSEDIDSGECEVVLKKLSIPILKKKLTLEEYGLTFAKGEYDETQTFETPAIVPPGSYTYTGQCKKGDKFIVCLAGKVDFKN